MIDTKELRSAIARHGTSVLNEDEILELLEVAEKNIAMKERMKKMEAALQDHHANAMCEGCDHSHPLTQLRLAAYQQSKLYADTVFALEKSK